MKDNNAGKLAAAIAAAVGAGSAGTADAATYTATLQSVVSYSANGSSAGELGTSTATWSYDDVTGLLSQTGGTFNVRFSIVPGVTTLFRHVITGLVIGNGAAASGTTFSCKEGNFGGGLGVSLCGNYFFGDDFINDSTVTYGPGTAASLALGNDDISLGPIQDINWYNGFNTVSWVGTTLTLTNRSCQDFCYDGGFTWVLSASPVAAVPVPAAVWLFGSAVAVLGVARRRSRD